MKVRFALWMVPAMFWAGCSYDYDTFTDGSGSPDASVGGAGGTSGTGGTGTGGTSTGGTGGTGTGGTSTGGTGGTGTGGTSTGGTGGTGTGGTSATGGTAGTGGTGGTAGAAGMGGSGGGAGSAGAGGSGGAAGSAGAGGSGGAAGSAGAGGSGGCGPTEKLCGANCVPLDDPQTGCADPSSCDPCVVPNATATCDQGDCAVGSCDAGFDDCDSDGTNGCESSLSTDVDNCGACGRVCADDHIDTLLCEQGLCTSTCEVGYGNCSQPDTGPDDGCESNFGTSEENCGSCGNTCPYSGSTSFVCYQGICYCDGNADCRIETWTSGLCSTGRCRCGGDNCRPGEYCLDVSGDTVCSCNGATACSWGETCCQSPAGCFDLDQDDDNCGACGHACPSGENCTNGTCG